MMSIFAPNLYLCAYHLRKDDTEGETHPLWSNCDRLLSHLTPKRLIPHLHITENRILLPPPQTEITFTLTDFTDIEERDRAKRDDQRISERGFSVGGEETGFLVL